MFQYTGEYYKTKNIYGNEFFTFTPTPLCKNFFIDIDNELLALLTTAHKLLGVLEGMGAYLPHVDSIIKHMCLKECCHSLEIDYKNSLLNREVMRKESYGCNDLGLITNLVAAQQFACDKKVGHQVLTKVYGILFIWNKSGS